MRTQKPTPSYLQLHQSGELKKRGDKLWNILSNCELCPRICGVNRLQGEKGFCKAGADLQIASFHRHFGEEDPLVGQGGSGTVFLTHCMLGCVFCLNSDISQGGDGISTSLSELAQILIDLQNAGCHNINFVSPTHYIPHLVKAIDLAAARGLHLPIVYNSCGWERVEILKLLNGIIDIYLPDFKYANNQYAIKYSDGAKDYFETTQKALLEMHQQVGVAQPHSDGILYRGLIIRHLVMPNNISGTQQIMNFIAQKLSPHTYINLMSQYQPMYKAFADPEIARPISPAEYNKAIEYAHQAGLCNLDIQDFQ